MLRVFRAGSSPENPALHVCMRSGIHRVGKCHGRLPQEFVCCCLFFVKAGCGTSCTQAQRSSVTLRWHTQNFRFDRMTIVYPNALVEIRLMDKILHDPKDPKLGELWYIPYYGSCRILSISRSKAPINGFPCTGWA